MREEMTMADDNESLVLLADGEEAMVVIDYTNHRGERAKRLIEPIALRWGKTQWHPEPQLLLEAYDVAKRDSRDFAVRDIHGVERVT